nr:MAG TPA: hypothetical protein [Caudoviricetes sp.]
MGLDTPGPGFVGLLRERARRSPARGFQRLQAPLGAARKPTTPLGVSHGEARKPTAPPGLLRGEVRKPTAPPGLLHGEARKPTAPPGLLRGEAGKPTAPPGLLHGEVRKPTTTVAFARPGAFPAARPAGTARFLITRGKASFYETATFGRRKVFFCSPFCGLLFCPARAKLALPAGEKPAARNPGRPAAARPTTATGSRFSRRQRERPPRRPRPSPPAREGSLGAPNDRTFPPGAERKARKEKGKEEPRMERAPPL